MQQPESAVGVSCHASKVAKGLTIEEQREDWLEDNPLSERRPDLALAEEGCPGDLLALAARCWADDAHSRPTFAQCAQALAALASRKTGTFGDSDFRCVLKTQDACVGRAQVAGKTGSAGDAGFTIANSHRRRYYTMPALPITMASQVCVFVSAALFILH